LISGPSKLSFEVRPPAGTTIPADGAADGRTFAVDPASFWQVHPLALPTFVGALLEAAAPQPGEHVLDLYAGAGALTAFLAERVGPGGRVIGVESAPGAVADAAANLAELPRAQVRRGRVDTASVAALLELGAELSPDVIVLDPPRAGAGSAIMQALCGLGPRVIAYVACDPAALARDAAVALAEGWQLASLRGFDAFPMTHHVECVATFQRQ
jgi:tRNA/tmRNA/rRNA uracil-C5-methylase (TrmA/RlmC/RlmD family)